MKFLETRLYVEFGSKAMAMACFLGTNTYKTLLFSLSYIRSDEVRVRIIVLEAKLATIYRKTEVKSTFQLDISG